MQSSDPILEELRKISAWADMQRKITKWSLVLVAALIPVGIIFVLLLENLLQTSIDDITSDTSMSWYTVDQHVGRGDFDSAIQMGVELVEGRPLDPDAHRRLARVYLSAGQIQNAEKHYAEVYRLFPSEEARDLLDAIRKRAQTDASNKTMDENGE